MKKIRMATLGFLLLAVGVGESQILTTLHDFSAFINFTNSDGAQVSSPLLPARDGSLYGTAYQGGTNGSGVVFRFTPGGTFKIMHTFSATPYQTNADGAYPYAALVQDTDGDFYGTTVGGGAYGNYGTVFKMTTNGTVSLLHSFNYSDGENPCAALTPAGGGTFYGAVLLGGANGNGSIFRVNTNGAFQSLHDFAAGNVNAASVYTNFDGSRPYGLCAGGDGWLYATTYYGGTNGNGTIVRYNTNNGAFTVLHTFGALDANYHNLDGANPYASLTLVSNGVFWGTATGGGTNGGGTIFQITTGGVFTVLHSFNVDIDGSAPSSALLRGRDGNFYSTTEYYNYGAGSIFQFTTNATLTTLHFFDQLNIVQSNYGWDGGNPFGGLSLGADGYLYGTTLAYGANTNGTIFRLIYPGISIAALPGTKVLVSWPTNQVGFILQVNTNLASTNWLTAAPSPVVFNDQYVVTNDTAGSKAFYRLKK
jgi:uncharacterized repeat protein (TIGR03803 family)